MCEEVEALAMKKAIALKLQSLLKDHSLTKTELAKRMKTSRAAVDRLLDESNPSITLLTLEKGAMALGHRLKIELVPAFYTDCQKYLRLKGSLMLLILTPAAIGMQ
jgi:antitoxin HicB